MEDGVFPLKKTAGDDFGLVPESGGQVIKPNFSVPRPPVTAVTTSALLVAALVKKCLEAGAREVKVIDHTFTNGRMCLETTGMRREVEAAVPLPTLPTGISS